MRQCGNELLVLERDRESRKDRRLDKKKIAQSRGFETTTAHTSHVDHVHCGHVTTATTLTSGFKSPCGPQKNYSIWFRQL